MEEFTLAPGANDPGNPKMIPERKAEVNSLCVPYLARLGIVAILNRQVEGRTGSKTACYFQASLIWAAATAVCYVRVGALEMERAFGVPVEILAPDAPVSFRRTSRSN